MRGWVAGGSSHSCGTGSGNPLLPWLAPPSSPSLSPALACPPSPLSPPGPTRSPVSASSPLLSAQAGPHSRLPAQPSQFLLNCLNPKGTPGGRRKGYALWPLTESNLGVAPQLSLRHSHSQSQSPLRTMSTPLGIPLNSGTAFTKTLTTLTQDSEHCEVQGAASSAHNNRLTSPDPASLAHTSETGRSSSSEAARNASGGPPCTGAVGTPEGAPESAPHPGARQGLATSPVIVISGPTASGKTRLAIRLALLLGGEIVSADSIQVYRGLDIGSAKSPLAERMGVPHHVIDILDPSQEYTAGDFFSDARAAVQEVQSRGKVAVVVGGTGLYLRWFLYGKPDTPRSDPAQVEAVEQEIQEAISRARAQARRGTSAAEGVRGGTRAADEAWGANRAIEEASSQATNGSAAQEGEVATGERRAATSEEGEGGDPEVLVDEWAAAVGALAAAGDPLTAGQLARNDWYRLKRAFTILRASGQPRSMHPLPSTAALGSSEGAPSELTHSDQARARGKVEDPATEGARPGEQRGGAAREDIGNGNERARHGGRGEGGAREGSGAGGGEGEQVEARGQGGAAGEETPRLDFDFRCFFLAAPRGELYRRIDRRCEEMVAEGLLKEALMLRRLGLHPDSSPATRGIGYRQALHFLASYEEALGKDKGGQGPLPFAEAKALFLSFLAEMQQASRNLAKRQTTWFRKERLYTWLDASLPLEEQVSCVLEGCKPQEGSGSGAPAAANGAAEALKRQSETEGRKMKGYTAQLQLFNDDKAIEKQVRWLEGQLNADLKQESSS